MTEESTSCRELKRAMFWRAWLAGGICGVIGMTFAFYALTWRSAKSSQTVSAAVSAVFGD